MGKVHQSSNTMGFELLHLCSAALLCILKAANIEGQCTLPSFESRNVTSSGYYSPGHTFQDGSVLTFECMSGHKPVDSRAIKSITCMRSQWTNLGLSCTRKSCGSPPEFANGRYEITGVLFGDTIKPICNKGFMLVGYGLTQRVCRDGGWDSRDPVCESVKCAAPPTVENGHLLHEPLESYEYTHVLTYRCNSGFSLSGSPNLHCSDDGTFKPDPPKCLDGCPKPEIPHAIRIGGKSPPYKIGHFIEYKCQDLYTLKGIKEIACTAEGWDPEPPKCIEPCSLPDFGRKVTLTKEFSSKNLFPHGSKVTFKCSSGYEPVDSTASNSVTCEETKWTKLHLTCKAKPQPPPVIENGKIEAVIYKCNSGFFLNGSSMLLFSEDGTFEQDPPKCLGKL
ncbi:complement component receptor 1-like protein [Danio rerio]|uniref:Complement component receptor 1-like protein n=1 Tax=Danio rerio TaxID=7955 RepID=A0A8N7TE76_DANRE|nr:complement receptor type 1 [Danio rerio]XP_693912.2 complement receptor type 1 [Danio rerio]|eukprot:XP_009295212.1 complement receptor type 1 [Danio rerio]